jgi:hypothetical protein
MSRRSDLRAQAFEIAGGRCEHPVLFVDYTGATRGTTRCTRPAAELAHIYPRGMGHTGYRDTLVNVMAACTSHARSTDDLSDPAWDAIRELLGDSDEGPDATGWLRAQLAESIDLRRQAEGVDLEGSDR